MPIVVIKIFFRHSILGDGISMPCSASMILKTRLVARMFWCLSMYTYKVNHGLLCTHCTLSLQGHSFSWMCFCC